MLALIFSFYFIASVDGPMALYVVFANYFDHDFLISYSYFGTDVKQLL
jgi:hypothetical protein